MIVRVFRNVSAGRETFVSCKAHFPRRNRRAAHVSDGRRPLAAARAARGYTLDNGTNAQPVRVSPSPATRRSSTGAFIDRLAEQLRPGDQAVVPRHGGQIEPLAAIYERQPYLLAGTPTLLAGRGALRLVLDGLATNYIDMEEDERLFANVNTPADYAAIHEVLA